MQLHWVLSASLFLPRSVVRDVWVTPKHGAMAVPEAQEQRSRVALTVTWMATTLVIALFVPDIGKVIELIGGISAFFIFIFPGKSEQWEAEEGCWCQKHCWWRVGAVMVMGSPSWPHFGVQGHMHGDTAAGPG